MTHRRAFTLILVLGLLGGALAPLAAATPGQVNINTAGADQLALLPRVGPSVAGRIVEFREANGPFKTLEDLLLVRGIGEKTFEQLKPYLVLSGETTLKEKVRTSESAEEGADG